MADSSYDVSFLSLSSPESISEDADLANRVDVVRWPKGSEYGGESSPGDLIDLMPAFSGLLEQITPDVLHVGPVQTCGFMAGLSGFHPSLITSWGYDILQDADRDDLSQWTTRFALRNSDMLLCDCDAVRHKVQSLVDYPDSRVVQFPWGVDLDVFHPGTSPLDLRSDLGWEDCFIVLSTRSWEPVYGIDVLIESFRLAQAERPKLRLVMLGDGSLVDEIEDSIVNSGLDDLIYRPGRVPHELLPEYFRASDAFVSCAHTDGSSVSLLEAMASGLPAIATDIPSNREWVIQDENGWLAAAGNSREYASALVQAASLSEVRRDAILKKNRSIAESRADWSKNSDMVIAAYDGLISGVRG